MRFGQGKHWTPDPKIVGSNPLKHATFFPDEWKSYISQTVLCRRLLVAQMWHKKEIAMQHL